MLRERLLRPGLRRPCSPDGRGARYVLVSFAVPPDSLGRLLELCFLKLAAIREGLSLEADLRPAASHICGCGAKTNAAGVGQI